MVLRIRCTPFMVKLNAPSMCFLPPWVSSSSLSRIYLEVNKTFNIQHRIIICTTNYLWNFRNIERIGIREASLTEKKFYFIFFIFFTLSAKNEYTVCPKKKRKVILSKPCTLNAHNLLTSTQLVPQGMGKIK